HDQRRAAIALGRALAAGELQQVALPDFLAGPGFQTQQNAAGAEGVGPVAIHRGRGARAAVVVLAQGDQPVVVAGVAVAPLFLAVGGIETDDDLFLLILGRVGEEPAPGHGDPREATRQLRLPEDARALRRPLRQQSGCPRDAVVVRPAPARPV